MCGLSPEREGSHPPEHTERKYSSHGVKSPRRNCRAGGLVEEGASVKQWEALQGRPPPQTQLIILQWWLLCVILNSKFLGLAVHIYYDRCLSLIAVQYVSACSGQHIKEAFGVLSFSICSTFSPLFWKNLIIPCPCSSTPVLSLPHWLRDSFSPQFFLLCFSVS